VNYACNVRAIAQIDWEPNLRPSSVFLFKLSSDAEKQFLQLAEEFAAAYQSLGLALKATRAGEPTAFRRARQIVQQQAIGYLDFNLQLFREMAASGESLRDTKVYLWRALKKLNLTPPSDVLSYIHDSDIVEIYYLDEFQAFRNFKFLELTSFTVDEMLCRPWYRNAARGLVPQMRMVALVLKGKLGKISEPVRWNVPEHIVNEKDTEGMCQFKMQLKHFIPLRQSGKVVAFISTNHSSLVSRRSGPNDAQQKDEGPRKT
jgi:hypothetical protein